MASELYGKIGRSTLLRRLAELERRLTDHSCLVPHSPEWLAFWDRQLYNHMTDQECIPLTVEAMRAMIGYSDNPASLIGSVMLNEDSEQ